VLKTKGPPVALALLVLALLAIRAGSLLQIAYPLAAIAVVIWLESVSVAATVSFVLWMWTLTPLVRRLADLQTGWHDPSLILLTPYLVTGWPAARRLLGLVMFPTRLTTLPRGQAVFVLAALGVGTGIPMGFTASPQAAALETLNWLVPVGFGWYVASSAEELTRIERAVVGAFQATALISAAYGIYQFLSPPPWDAEWMRNSGMSTIGLPEAFAVRVFSTMHSPGVFGLFIFIPLVLWLAKPRLTGLLTASLATIVLVLSEVRTAWVGLAVSTGLLFVSASNRARFRLITLTGLAAFCVAPFLFLPEVSERVSTRFATFAEPDNDESALSRVEGHLLALDFVATNPFGAGIGSSDARIEQVISMRDSMLVAALVQFGLVGTFLYAVGVCLLFAKLWTYHLRAPSPDGRGLACAGIGLLSVACFGAVTVSLPGAFFWLIGGLAVAHGRRREEPVAAWRPSTVDTADAPDGGWVPEPST
jgi:hypothetical protein